jgi:hypothetical protein
MNLHQWISAGGCDYCDSMEAAGIMEELPPRHDNCECEVVSVEVDDDVLDEVDPEDFDGDLTELAALGPSGTRGGVVEWPTGDAEVIDPENCEMKYVPTDVIYIFDIAKDDCELLVRVEADAICVPNGNQESYDFVFNLPCEDLSNIDTEAEDRAENIGALRGLANEVC